ncbi:NEL-type E3 ubiquitin ligase domain-containing protein [Pseudomonas sp. Irchel s3h14]|uniref:NEL-type E3 ubiquitin ligase domain-containing protein n=1 Tax=Pseudomonas sp. Irchel s3h14 TaxID=2009179 RepID=UPI000BA4D163|nr:NEL-type E3 ubiquitin ligase domain-containing protein [Pseudomonas sp. Irchel s3h14]
MSGIPSAQEKGLHNHFIKKKLHDRIRHLTPANIRALDRARTPGGLAENAMPDWFQKASGDQRHNVRDDQKRSRTSNETLAKTLAGLKGVTEFAQPLLEAALQKKFGLKVDVAQTWLYEPFAGSLITHQTLLQLALRNFEEDQAFDEREVIAERGKQAAYLETQGGPYGWDYPQKGPSTRYRIKKLPIKPADFASLCRELDIGKQYQEHLTAMFDAADRAATVRTQTVGAWTDSLRVHAHIAHLKSLITPSAYSTLLAMLNGDKSPTLDGERVTCSQLHVLGSPVSELFVIGASRRKGKKVNFSWTHSGVNLFDVLGYQDSRIIVCIPGDPVAPVMEYASLKSFENDLSYRLRDVNYQRSFLRLIPHGDAGKFLGKIKTALQTLKWNPDFPYRKQTLLGHIDGIYENVYRDEPVLDISEEFFDTELFGELYTRHQTRLKETAEQLAVPTAKVDHDAWYERLARYAEWGLNILNVAAFFVPGLGEVMMAVMAVQLTTDIYHGVEAWSIGDTDQAWSYLKSVAVNVAFMAAVGAVASNAPKVLSTPIVDGLVKVKLPFGSEQLWRPGLTPYLSDRVLPAGLKPDKLGQYEVGGKTYIRLDGNVYEKTFDPTLNKWRLKHPTDPNAYSPVLEHNGEGAWRHRFERPLGWDRATLLRRLGPVTDGIDAATLEKIADISGVNDDVLRKIHTDNLRLPSALSDTLRQFQIDRQLNEMIEQIRLDQPVPDSRYNAILPHVINMPRWPQGRVIDVFDNASLSGASSRYAEASTSVKPSIKISREDVSAGKLPERVLAALDEEEIVRLLGGEGARVEAERETVFRQQLGDHLSGNKTSLFDKLSQDSKATTRDIQALQRTLPSLSTDAAQEVLANATTKERLHIKQTGRHPTSLLLKGRARARVTRLNKALAGLQLESMASSDSQRLALHSLEKLPGWPKNLRLEVRQGDCGGKLLDSIGSETAEQVKYLVKDGYQHHQASQFQAFDQQINSLNSVPKKGDNFFSSLMHALPDDARTQLGMPKVAQDAKLQKTLTTYAMGHRDQMMVTLVPNTTTPRFRSPVRLADGRVGYPLSGRGAGATVNPSLVSRLRDVYPIFSDELAELMVIKLALDGMTETQIAHFLNMRGREYEALTAQLEQWITSGDQNTVRHQVARNIQYVWQQRGIYDGDASVSLDVRAADSLPELAGNFPHVSNLNMSVGGVLSQTPEAFVRQFPNARSLTLGVQDGVDRVQLAERLKALSSIRELEMAGPLGPEFTEAAQSVIDAMPQLQRLDVIGVAGELDVSRLTQLHSLSVYGTTEAWPKGALQLPQLRSLDLTHSSVKTLPPEWLSGHESLWPGMKLNWARLSTEDFVKAYEYVHDNPAHLLDSGQMLDRYCQGTLHNALETSDEFSKIALGRMKAEGLAGQALLARINALRQDGQALRQQLEAWQQRTARANGRQVNIRERESVARRIRECWRDGLRKRYGGTQEAQSSQPQAGPSTVRTWPVMPRQIISSNLDLSGWALGDLPELPALSATNFAHVQTLQMSGVVASSEDFSRFLSGFTDIRGLDLSGNQLQDLPSALGNLGKLSYLELSRNHLTMTPSMQQRLNRLSALESLDLRYNRLDSLDVSAMTRLKTLRVGHTAIKDWPKGALDLPGLGRLELNNSAITTIPEAALTGHDALRIDMTGCRLTAKARTDLLASTSSETPMGISRASLQAGITMGEPEYFPVLVAQNPDLLLPLPVVPGNDLTHLTPQARLRRLDPDLPGAEAIQMVDELTLRHGGAGPLYEQLAKWDRQHQALTKTLNTWIEIPPQQMGESSPPVWIAATQRRQAADRIMACWRQNLRGAQAVESASGGYILDLSDNPLGNLPDLPADFAHVGALNLNNVYLREEGLSDFLGAFTHVHTLALNANALYALPESVISLNSLKRLSAVNNRFSNAPQLQRQLAGLSNLESLNLAENWLESLDVSPLTRLQALDLSGNRLVIWPQGTLQLPSLSALDLRDNMIESIPSVLMADEYRGLRAGTNLASNETLDGASLLMLRNQVLQGEEIVGWTPEEIDEALERIDSSSHSGTFNDSDSVDSIASDVEVDMDEVTGTDARERWIAPSAADSEELIRIWNDFEQAQNNQFFFNLLTKMEGTTDFLTGRSDLVRRVHTVLRVADSDAGLRDTIFEMARSGATCVDGQILLFSDIEVKAFEFETTKSTSPGQQGNVLFRLGRSLFRLGKVEEIANRDIVQRQAKRRSTDPAEVRLAYRIGLAERLELPGQPRGMRYSGNVTPVMLDAAHAEVIAAEQSSAFIDDLVGRNYWSDYLKDKYPERFAQVREGFAGREHDVDEAYPNYGEGDEEQYKTAMQAIEVDLLFEQGTLVRELSEKERTLVGL